jgi:prepilin-type N-terminal cleavage/methylation domain-containing protein
MLSLRAIYYFSFAMIWIILLYMLRKHYLVKINGPGWFITKGKITIFQLLKGIKKLPTIGLLFLMTPRAYESGRNFRVTSGYTIIELISVIAIIGILVSIVMFDQVSYYNKLSFTAEVEKFIGDMEYARDYAISRNKQCIITTSDGNPPNYDFSLRTADGLEAIVFPSESNHSINLPDGASLDPAVNEIVLDTRGTPAIDETITYTSTKFSQTAVITLNSVTGFITQ